VRIELEISIKKTGGGEPADQTFTTAVALRNRGGP
jgi:hypothetical protein